MPEEKVEEVKSEVVAPGPQLDPKEKAGWAIPEPYKTKAPGPIPPIPPLPQTPPPQIEKRQIPAPANPTAPVEETKGNIFSNIFNKIFRRG